MKKPTWLRVAGWLVFVSLLGVITDMQFDQPTLLYTISLIVCCASLLVWLGGTMWWRMRRWRLKATAEPPVEAPLPARPVGPRLRRLAFRGPLVVFVLLLLILVLFWLPAYRVQRIEKRVTQGMPVAELMRVVDGWTWMTVRSLEADAESVWVTAAA